MRCTHLKLLCSAARLQRAARLPCTSRYLLILSPQLHNQSPPSPSNQHSDDDNIEPYACALSIGYARIGRCLQVFSLEHLEVNIWKLVAMQSDPSALQAATKSPQATVRARARAVLAAIGAETLPDAPGASPAGAASLAAAQPAQPGPDLMGDLLGPDEGSEPPLTQQAPAAAAQLPPPTAAASGGDLMGESGHAQSGCVCLNKWLC